MKVRAIIQARMGSSRLRGKTLSPIDGVPLLKRVYDCVMHLELTDDIIVATSDFPEDDEIEVYCINELKCKCIRGNSEDVLSRFVLGSKDLDGRDVVLRITADNMFYQKDICAELLAIHNKNENDYTGIDGLSHVVCELIRVASFRKLDNERLNDYDREHVTPYIINNPEKFKLNLVERNDFELHQELDRQLTVDSLGDKERVEKLLKYFKNNDLEFSRENLYKWLKKTD